MAEQVGYTMSVDVVGAKELQEAFTSIDGFAKQAYLDAINKAAISFEALARSYAPHKTGALWNSIHAQPAQVTSDNVEAHVGTDLKYARAQEYGTQGLDINSHSKIGTKFTYKGNIPPKLYFKKAKEEMKPLLTTFLEDAVKKIIDHLSIKEAV